MAIYRLLKCVKMNEQQIFIIVPSVAKLEKGKIYKIDKLKINGKRRWSEHEVWDWAQFIFCDLWETGDRSDIE